MRPEVIFNDTDVIIDTYSNISGFSIRATHIPTGFVETVEGDKSSSRIKKNKEVIFNLKIRVIVDYFSKILLIDFKEKHDRLKIVADAINELVAEGVEFEKAVKIMADKTFPAKHPLATFGYAEGWYECTCKDCATKFLGEKRAWRCEECAFKAKLGKLKYEYQI